MLSDLHCASRHILSETFKPSKISIEKKMILWKNWPKCSWIRLSKREKIKNRVRLRFSTLFSTVLSVIAKKSRRNLHSFHKSILLEAAKIGSWHLKSSSNKLSSVMRQAKRSFGIIANYDICLLLMKCVDVRSAWEKISYHGNCSCSTTWW